MFVIKALIGALTGSLGQTIAEAYKARAMAQTNQEKIEWDGQVALLENQQASQHKILAAIARMLVFAPYVPYIWKLIVYDKMYCVWKYGAECATEDLSQNLWNILYIMLGYYFLQKVGEFRRVK